MGAEQVNRVSKRIIRKAVKAGFPVGETPLEQSGIAFATSLMLDGVQERLKRSDATAAYAALLPTPPDDETPGVFMELSVVVDLPPAEDVDNIRRLDSLVKDGGLFQPRVGEPIDFGFNRIHGRKLQRELQERYDGAFTKVYPLPKLRR